MMHLTDRHFDDQGGRVKHLSFDTHIPMSFVPILFFVFYLWAIPLSRAVNYTGSREIHTELGNLKITGSPAGSSDTITLNGTIAYRQPGYYISFYENFKMKEGDAVIFGVNPGGSANPVDNLHVLLLLNGKKPIILSDKNFYSKDGTAISTSNTDEIIIDLGFDAKRKKRARVHDEQLTIEYSEILPPFPMTDEDCKWLHEYTANECIEEKRGYKVNCEDYAHTYSGHSTVNMTGITTLSNHPGFISAALSQICLDECQTGLEVSFSEFERKVCSIK